MSSEIGIGLICTLISVIIGVISFHGGKISVAKKDGEKSGEWRGRMEERMFRMGDDIEKILTKIDRYIDDSNKADDELRKQFDESIRRLHKRIDDHLRLEHGYDISKTKEDT